MSIYSDFIGAFKRTPKVEQVPVQQPRMREPEAAITNRTYSVPYDGEKTQGSLGPIKKYVPLYEDLRNRSWQLYLDSDLAQIVISKYLVWVVKNGLRLQCTPVSDVINGNEITNTMDFEQFSRTTEQRFKLWQTSKSSTHNREKSFSQLQHVIKKNAIVGGDCLVILRRKNKTVTVQCVDGIHLSCNMNKALANGNIILNGIEFDKNGEHYQYHVKVGSIVIPVLAYEKKTGLRVAWLDYGSEYRMDNHRGIPIIATAIETISKIDRYKDATIDQAEEIRKISYAITHKIGSTGENPLDDIGELFSDGSGDSDAVKYFESGEKMAANVSASIGRKMLNMPIDSDLKSLDAKNELYFEPFYTTLADTIPALLNMPPNVAWSKYNDSFSASRAATKDWEHSIDHARQDYDDQTLGYVYKYWFYWETWNGNLRADGYVSAHERQDTITVEAYTAHRFLGRKFPHIDPVKEAEASRLKLGTAAAHLPLGNADDESESLMSGDYDTNVERISREIKKAESLGIKPVEKVVPGEPTKPKLKD